MYVIGSVSSNGCSKTGKRIFGSRGAKCSRALESELAGQGGPGGPGRCLADRSEIATEARVSGIPAYETDDSF
jgi:hypothetical protein